MSKDILVDCARINEELCSRRSKGEVCMIKGSLVASVGVFDKAPSNAARIVDDDSTVKRRAVRSDWLGTILDQL